MDNRTNKQNYYLDIADSVLKRATCLRRKYGAIIVRNDEIISTGYNGAPRGRRNCSDMGFCTREFLKIPSGERYELCRSVHAEANAIISASRRDMIGATLYLVGRDAKTNELSKDAMCCSMCKRQIINAGIDRVVIRTSPTEYITIPVSDWIENDESLPNM
ncbi:MAG: cytidine deaminase [Oscillospiraceae bacterium]|nr:cytidine deaminase [Oscillospiraceae bacterium]